MGPIARFALIIWALLETALAFILPCFLMIPVYNAAYPNISRLLCVWLILIFLGIELRLIVDAVKAWGNAIED